MKRKEDDVLYHKLISQVKSMVDECTGEATPTAAKTTWLSPRGTATRRTRDREVTYDDHFVRVDHPLDNISVLSRRVLGGSTFADLRAD